jgi:hypothetical protein
MTIDATSRDPLVGGARKLQTRRQQGAEEEVTKGQR